MPANAVTGRALAMRREAVAPTLVTQAERTGVVPGTVIAVLSGTSVTGRALREGSPALVPRTSNAGLNIALSRLGATSIQPLFARLRADAAGP